MLRFIVLVLALNVASIVHAQVTVTPAPATAPQQFGGKWRITFGGTDSGTYTINGGTANDVIEWIRVSGNSTITLNIGGSENLETIEEIRRTSGSGVLNIGTFIVLDDLGPASPAATQVIQASNFNSLIDVRGSVFTRVSTVGSGTRTFAGIRVSGDLRGDIINSFGRIERVSVDGAVVGSTTDPVQVFASGGVGFDSGGFVIDFPQLGGIFVTGSATDMLIGQASGTPTMKLARASFGQDFTGTVRLSQLSRDNGGFPPYYNRPRFTVGRDFSGTFFIGQGLLTDGLPPESHPYNNQLVIGRTLKAGSSVTFPAANGLRAMSWGRTAGRAVDAKPRPSRGERRHPRVSGIRGVRGVCYIGCPRGTAPCRPTGLMTS